MYVRSLLNTFFLSLIIVRTFVNFRGPIYIFQFRSYRDILESLNCKSNIGVIFLIIISIPERVSIVQYLIE